MNLTPLQQRIFLDRYSLKDENGNPTEQTIEEMWWRVAQFIGKGERTDQDAWETKFYKVLENFKFVPAGRILAGAGSHTQMTFDNCYVIPSPEDSRHGILDNITTMVDIMARGGGVGVNLSSLRPKGSYIKTVNGHSSGPVSWMELYSVATGDVIQQGGSRRGALMLMLNDSHPDVREFITRKSKFVTDKNGDTRPEYLQYANISVAISDAFMQAVKDDLMWNFTWNDGIRNYGPYESCPAQELWDLICTSAWKSADPGLVFMDRANEWSNSYYFSKLECVNPCGEQPLNPYGVCLLGAMNLSAYVQENKYGDVLYFNNAKLMEDVKTAVRFLDNTIDLNEYFLPENEQTQKHDIRRMGLGTMGLADTLIKLRIPYGSQEAIKFTETVFREIRDAAYEASAELAQERGTFGKFDKNKYSQGKFIKTLPDHIRNSIYMSGIRNCFLLTNAPTGTTSLLAGVSSGIEPVFDFAMQRADRTGTSIIYHPLAQEWFENHPRETQLPDYFVNAEQVTPEEHLQMQSAAQRYIDSAISKTINLPASATVQDIKDIYMRAYDLGCKGITVYRDSSRNAVLSHITNISESDERTDGNIPSTMQLSSFRTIPNPINGTTTTVNTPVGKAHITVNKVDNQIVEVFINVGKAGSDIQADAEMAGRLLSIIFRTPTIIPYNSLLAEVSHQLDSIGGASSTGFGHNRITSLADAVAQVLFKEFESGNVMETPDEPSWSKGMDMIDIIMKETEAVKVSGHKDLCPECGCYTLVHQEGCATCTNCGFSKC